MNLQKIGNILFGANLVLSIFITTFAITKLAMAFEFRVQVVDEPIQSYVNEYHKLLEHYCPQGKYKQSKHYVIELVEKMDRDEWIGVCDRKFNGYHISLSKPWWDTATESDRRELVFHEMAHCVIDKDHEKYENHYMYPYFSSLPRAMYTDQAIQDIVDKCFEGK